MNDLYAEAVVKKKVTAGDTMIKVGVIAVVIAIFVVAVVLGKPLLIFIGGAAGVFAYWFLPQLSVMYEYVFCDGQLDFDAIMAGEKRKHVYRLDFDNVTIMAPANSHALDSYKQSGIKIRNFSSLEKDRKVYGIVENTGDIQTLVYFEPNEKMLSYIKQKAPRKVSEY